MSDRPPDHTIESEHGLLMIRVEGYGFNRAQKGSRDSFGQLESPDEPEHFDQVRVFIGQLEITEQLTTDQYQAFCEELLESPR